VAQMLLLRVRLGSALGAQYKGEMYGHTVRALADVRAFGDRLAAHPQCPSIVRSLYERARDLIAGAVPPPPPGAAG